MSSSWRGWAKNLAWFAIVAWGLWMLVLHGFSMPSITGSIAWYGRYGQKIDAIAPMVMMGFLGSMGIFTSITLLNALWMLAAGRRVPLIYLGHCSASLAVLWSSAQGGSGKAYEVVLQGFNTSLKSVGTTIVVAQDPWTGEFMDVRDIRIDNLLQKFGLWVVTFALTAFSLAMVFGLPKTNPTPQHTIPWNSGIPMAADFFFGKLHGSPGSATLLFCLAVALAFASTQITDFLHITKNEHRRVVTQSAGQDLHQNARLGIEFRYVPEVEKRNDFAAASQTWKPTKPLADGVVIPATLIELRDWGRSKSRSKSDFRLAIFRFDGLFPQPVFASEFFLRGDAEDRPFSELTMNSPVSIQIDEGGKLRLAKR